MEEKGIKESDPVIAEEIEFILESQLPSQEKEMLVAALTDIPPQEVNTCTSSSRVELEKKPSVALDTLTEEEISSVLDSDLTSEEKSSVLACIPEDTSPSKVSAGSTGSRVEIEGKNQRIEEKEKGEQDNLLRDGTTERIDDSLSFHPSQEEGKNQHIEETENGEQDNLLRDGTTERIDESLSLHPSQEEEAKKKVALESNVSLEEKLTCNQIEEDTPPSGIDTSSTSSKIELEDKTQHPQMKAYAGRKSKSFRSQAPPQEGYLIWQEMKEEEFLTVSVKGQPESNVDGKEDERIHKLEAVCKYCYVKIKENEQEKCVLKAKCRCKLTLIHEECANLWSDERGNKCVFCEEDIKNIGVTVSLDSSPRTSAEKHDEKPGSMPKRSWCCLGYF